MKKDIYELVLDRKKLETELKETRLKARLINKQLKNLNSLISANTADTLLGSRNPIDDQAFGWNIKSKDELELESLKK